jgi:sterol desaturase/sphingolipid hydroxylase (fatty acid hydroxylase superfamily)
MNWWLALEASGLSLLFLIMVFIPMEKVFPAKRQQKIFRKHWITDLFFFLGQYLVWSGLVLWALAFFSTSLSSIVPTGFRNAIGAQPWWLQAIEVIVMSDILIYWGHRLQHRVDFLWRFHKVHHSAEHLDWLAAHREHPVDSVYTITLINLPAFILGFPLESLAGLIAFRGIWAVYIHSNVRLPLGPLKWFIGAPELHHWHHDLDRDAGNYANISPLMDIMFGTYTCPGREPEQFGIKEPFPKSYLGQLIYPMLPHSIARRFLARHKNPPVKPQARESGFVTTFAAPDIVAEKELTA